MEKALFRVFLSLLLMISAGFWSSSARAQGDSREISAPNVLSKNCEEVLLSSSIKDIVNDPLGINNSIPPVENNNSDIMVILSESIRPNGSKYSCGEIVSCLRQKWKGKPGSELLVTKDIRTHYDACIVSGKDGLDLLSNYANLVYRWIAGIVGSICILVIIFSGIQISIGGLSQEEVSAAKDRVTRALVGIAVLFLSAFILYTINPLFFV